MTVIVGDPAGYGKPMRDHEVRVQRPGERFPRRRELAWRLAEVAGDPVPVEPEVAEMVANADFEL
jgi:2-methylcitrate dehydratase